MTVLSEQTDILDRIVRLFGGPIQTLAPTEGVTRLMALNALLHKSFNRLRDARGRPGGITYIQNHHIPVIVGDLHANVDNLLTILCTNGLLQKLDDGTASLVLLGDAIHEEEPHALHAMDNSLLIMDLIFTLMLRYPYQVSYSIGNHDGFSEEITKDGVPQGLLWAKHLSSIRGNAYLEAMQMFYDLSPRLAQSQNFLACHAGPPLERVSFDMMNNIADHPQIANDLVWNRVRSPACPNGYSRKDVRRFRKSMEVAPDLPFIVGHSPLSDGATFWENIGHTPSHHVVYSAHQHQVGVFTLLNGKMRGCLYTTEPLRDRANQLAESV